MFEGGAEENLFVSIKRKMIENGTVVTEIELNCCLVQKTSHQIDRSRILVEMLYRQLGRPVLAM